VAFSHPIKLLSSALGPPPKDVIDEAHGRGLPVAALVGHVDQARKQVETGIDIVVAQGTEAAGHTGVVATMVLTPDVVDAIHPTPVLAAGGIGSGRQMAAALALGAQGVWTGSIWLAAKENDELSPVVVDKLLKATARDTVRTRAWTGKPARLLRTAWTDAWDDPESPGTLQMPLQFMLTAEAQHRIFLSENEALIGMPVGQIVGRMNEVRPAGEIVRAIAAECAEVIDQLARLAAERELAP
jgi:NAD(P)H-dependent flavin oxidoreductase YrpB (nitropropane dioxygenase family)